MKPRTRLLYSILLNAALVVLCLFTSTNAYFGYWGNLFGYGGVLIFTFFTNDTLILLGLSSLLYLIDASLLYGKTKPIPQATKPFGFSRSRW